MLSFMPRKRLVPVAVLALFLLGAGEPSRPLTDQDLDHLSAYAKLLSLVRFFHPSDAVAAADWNRVAVAGVKVIEGAEDSESLARTLETFFHPLAPTLRVVPKGSRWEMPAELRKPDGPFRIVAWRHYGGGFGSDLKVFSSERIDDRNSTGFGTLAVAMPARPFQGNHLSLTAWVRAEVEGDGRVQLGLRVVRPGDKPGFFDNMADRPILDTPWRKVKIAGEVAVDAERIVILLVLTGNGKVWLDEVELDAPPIIEPLLNCGARGPQRGRPKTGLPEDTYNLSLDKGETGQQPPDWTFPYESIRAGYHLAVERGEGCKKGGCARIESSPISTPRFVRPDEGLEVDLGAGLTALLPMTLYADDRGTLPQAAPVPITADVNADTREARLAAVALAWGILQHLHPELRPDDPEWSAELRPALAAAAEDRESFLRATRRFLVPLHDPRARFVRKDGVTPQALPLAWEQIEGQLTITGASADSGVKPGDVVITLNGRPAEEVLQEEEALTSAATPEARRWRALERLLYGPPGSRVILGLKRGVEVELFQDTRYDRLPPGTPFQPVAEPRPGIVYVDLARIEEEDFEAMLPRLASVRGVIFDLRQGSNVSRAVLSHLTDRTLQTSKWQVPVVMRPDRRGMEWLTTFLLTVPMKPRFRRAAFLADGRSDGFSETLLETVEEYRLAEIVGARSGGNNGAMNWSDLPGGYFLSWTGQRVLKHDGSPLHGTGVAPTVPAFRTVQGVAAGRDEIVEKAVESLLRD